MTRKLDDELREKVLADHRSRPESRYRLSYAEGFLAALEALERAGGPTPVIGPLRALGLDMHARDHFNWCDCSECAGDGAAYNLIDTLKMGAR